MTRRLVWAIVLAAGLLCGGPALAQSAATFDVVMAQIDAGDYAGARATVARLPASQPIRAANARFVEALILRQQRRFDEAAALMRSILDQYPRFARVRHELAVTLYAADKGDAAAYQFELLARTTTSDPLRAQYERYVTAIHARRPWQLNAAFGFVPSTNINKATHPQIIMVGGLPFRPTETAKSGIGVNFGLAGSYRFDLREDLDLIVGATGTGFVYRNHAYDQVVAGAFAQFSYRRGAWRLGGGLGAERELSGWQGYRTSIGPQGAVSYDFGAHGEVALTGSLRRHVFDAGRADNEARGGVVYTRGVGNASSLSIGVEAGHVWTDMAHNEFTSVRPWFRLASELPMGLIADVGLSFETRDYRSFVPGLGKKRDEVRWQASVGTTMKGLAFAGFAPRLEYSYDRTDSRIDLFDTESHNLALTLTKAF